METNAACAAAALLALNGNAAKRVEDINGFDSVPNHDHSDAKNNSECPMLDSFYGLNGNPSI